MEADVDEKYSAFEAESGLEFEDESEPDFVLVESVSQLTRGWFSMESIWCCS